MVPRYPYYDMYFYSPEALLNDEFTPRYKKLGGDPGAESVGDDLTQMRLLGLLPSLVAHITKGKNAVYLRQINNNVEEYIVQFPVRLVWMLVKKMRGVPLNAVEYNTVREPDDYIISPGKEDAIADAYLIHKDAKRAIREMWAIRNNSVVGR